MKDSDQITACLRVFDWVDRGGALLAGSIQLPPAPTSRPCALPEPHVDAVVLLVCTLELEALQVLDERHQIPGKCDTLLTALLHQMLDHQQGLCRGNGLFDRV